MQPQDRACASVLFRGRALAHSYRYMRRPTVFLYTLSTSLPGHFAVTAVFGHTLVDCRVLLWGWAFKVPEQPWCRVSCSNINSPQR